MLLKHMTLSITSYFPSLKQSSPNACKAPTFAEKWPLHPCQHPRGSVSLSWNASCACTKEVRKSETAKQITATDT